MRRPVGRIGSWLIPFGCVSVALGLVAACEEDSSPNGGTGVNLDGSVPTLDGSPLPTTDAAPDVDAGPPRVTVRVRDKANQPIAGATVVFGNAAGDVIQALQSDAAGSASLEVPSGSQVTVGLGGDRSPRLLTITSVEPGDEIIAVEVTPAEGDPTNVAVTEPADGGPNVSYYLHRSGACSAYGSPPLSYPVDWRCAGPGGKFPVVVDGFDDKGQIVGFTFARGLTATAGGTVTPTFGAWSTAVTQQTIIASNLNDAGASNTVSYGELADGVLTETRSWLDLPGDGGTTAQATLQGRPGFPEAAQWDVTSREYVSGGVIFVGKAVRGAAPTGNATTALDFGTRLPAITTSSFDAGAPERPFVSWTPSASLADADGTYVVLRWQAPADGGVAVGSWTFVAPPGATSVVAPALPSGVQGPGAEAQYMRPARVVTVEASFVNGYAMLRKTAGALHPSDSLIEDNGGNWVPPLPVDGTVRFTAFTRNGD